MPDDVLNDRELDKAFAEINDENQDLWADAEDKIRGHIKAERERRESADEIIRDCWEQFAFDGHYGKWSGGLSTLEAIREYLLRYEADSC